MNFVQECSMKFNEFAQTYKLHIQAHLKPRTVEQYSDILRRILVPRFGKRELTDVRLHDLRHSYATCAVEVGISMPVIGASRALDSLDDITLSSGFGSGC